MGSQVIEAALRQGVSCQRESAPIALSPIHPLPGSGTVEGSRAASSILARASVTSGVCLLWLLIGAAEDKGLCGESGLRAQALVVSTEKARNIIEPYAMRDESLLVSQVVETTVIEQKQILERGRKQIDVQQLDAPQGKATQSAPAQERKQVLEHNQEWDKVQALARALTSSLQGELDAVRSAAEAGRIKQREALEQERGRADTLAREVTSLRAELDAARNAGPKAAQAAEAEIKQREAVEQERGRADTLAREVTSLRADLDAARNAGPKAAQAAEAEVKQREALEQERGRADTLAHEVTSLRADLDAARNAGPKATQAAEAEVKQREALEQERSRADTLAREVTSLRADLDAARNAGQKATQAAEAEIKQREALEQERGRADTLAREVTSLRADLDAAQNAGQKAAQAAEADVKQREALEQRLKQERDKAAAVTREVTSLRADLDAAQNAGQKATQAAEADVKQREALEQGLKQERDRTTALASELTSLRGELDTARAANLAAARAAEAAKVEQQLAFGKERAKTETLARELASARKEAEERSALLAAAHAEALQATETNNAKTAERERALTSERDRADALARELTSVRNELEAGKKQIAASNAVLIPHSHEPAADSSQVRIAVPSSGTIEGEGRSQEQISGEAVVWTSERSSAAELARPEAQARSTAREAASDLGPKVATGTERSTSASAVTHSPVDEQRLLARANALLRQADISGARPLLEHAVERGSARAAFMLAETYDARVLQSWRARGISGDLTKARELYERAQAGGIEDAKERIEALK